MKKKTTKELAVVPAKKATREWKRGRKKEKVQLSVRIDKAIMDVAYERIQKTGRRITDMLERGLFLALSEEMRLPPIASQARFVVENADIKMQRRMIKMAVLARFDEVRTLSMLEQCHREFHLATIDSVEEWPDYEKGLALIGQAVDLRQIEA